LGGDMLIIYIESAEDEVILIRIGTHLKEFIAKIPSSKEAKPNGQTKYTFSDGLVINLYETGAYVFQGNIKSLLKNRVEVYIESLNSI
jgi:hypothetical protein